MQGALCSCPLQDTDVFTAKQAQCVFPFQKAFGEQGSHPRCSRVGHTT